MKTVLAFFCLLLAAVSLAAQSASDPATVTGTWAATLNVTRPDGALNYQVPFELVIEAAPSGGIQAAILNGSDRMAFTSATLHGVDLTLRLEQYDATLTATCAEGKRICTEFKGEYVRQKGSSLSRFEFAARRLHPPPPAQAATLATDWQFSFTTPDGKPAHEATAPGHFALKKGRVEGTIAPVSGDFGIMAGTLRDGELHLSRFDGIHVLRLDGRVVSAQRIEGVLHASRGEGMNFTATATASAAATGFDEAEHLTSVADPAEPFRFHGLDAAGANITQDDARFKGKVVFLDLFGTWCPNCHDEAPVLQAMYEKYRGQGFEVVGLSYEYVDDRARNLHLLDVYRKKYGVSFPLLLAGTTDQGEIARTLPQLKNFGAYPTGIFLDRHGRVRLIHAGFSGPATGRLDELRHHFEATVERLLAEP